MGGIMLHASDCAPFPIDAKQLHYLVTKGFVAFPLLDERMIHDKDKADFLLRVITLGQVLWFLVNVSGRAASHLVITCLELTAAAFIVCSVGTSLCWVRKPADIHTTEEVQSNTSIADILLNAGEEAQKPYIRTPLDFISRKEWPWSIYWSNWINILRKLHINFAPKTKPVERLENTIFLELPTGANLTFLGLTAVYSAIFIAGWQYSFPTQTEQTLWRAASIAMMGSLIAYVVITAFAFTVYPSLRLRLAPRLESGKTESQDHRLRRGPLYDFLARHLTSIAACVRNNSPSRDPALEVPLKAILPIYVVGLFYCHARTFLLIEDFVELRSLPTSAYQDVNWWTVFPHL